MKKYSTKGAESIAIRDAQIDRDIFTGNVLFFMMSDKYMQGSKLKTVFDASIYLHLTDLRANCSVVDSMIAALTRQGSVILKSLFHQTVDTAESPCLAPYVEQIWHVRKDDWRLYNDYWRVENFTFYSPVITQPI